MIKNCHNCNRGKIYEVCLCLGTRAGVIKLNAFNNFPSKLSCEDAKEAMIFGYVMNTKTKGLLFNISLGFNDLWKSHLRSLN